MSSLASYKFYYFDVILKPFSRFMVRAIERIKPLGINVICTGHGPVHRDNISEIIALTGKLSEEYLKLTSGGEVKRVLIAYVSAYGFTGRAAGYVAEGIRSESGYVTDVTDIENITPAELDIKIAASDAILIGSPTINQNTLLPVYTLFALINPLRDRGKVAGAFGSYGWSGEAPKIILDNLRNLKLKTFDETAGFKFAPDGDKKESLIGFGRKFASFVAGESSREEK